MWLRRRIGFLLPFPFRVARMFPLPGEGSKIWEGIDSVSKIFLKELGPLHLVAGRVDRFEFGDIPEDVGSLPLKVDPSPYELLFISYA